MFQNLNNSNEEEYKQEEKKPKINIKNLFQEQNLFLVDLTVSPENKIEVFIDSLKGVNVGTCRTVCKELEALLDRESEDFDLTVSSAGIGYPFKVPQQYEKNLNNLVEVRLQNGNKLQGKLKAYSEKGIVLECEEKQSVEGKKKKETVRVEKNIDFIEIKEVKDIVIF